MSARTEDEGFLALRVIVAHDVDDPAAFGRAIARFHDAIGFAPDRLTGVAGKRSTRAFKPAVLEEALTDPHRNRVLIWSQRPDQAEAYLHLRDDPAVAEFTDRDSAVVVPGRRHLPALLAFVEQLDAHFGIVGGGITWHSTWLYAAKESKRRAVEGEWDQATVERIEWDAWKWRKTRTKLTRLTPLTIIGPDIWAALPPMPAFDPMPTIENLGNCKLLTAWPEPCEPRDPAFLRGTRALREWLWPYTIQNPADHVDNDPPDA